MRPLTMAAITALAAPAAPARAQHDHGGMPGVPSEAARSPEAATRSFSIRGSASINRKR